MLQGTLRALIALVASIASYLCYAWLVVPVVVPASEPGVARKTPPPPPVALPRTNWTRHFPDQHWVQDRATKVLVTRTGKLLFRTLVEQDDGHVELKPLALVIERPQESAGQDAPSDTSHPIILEAPRGAVLQLEGNLSFGRGGPGKLDWGRLLGPVTIHSAMRDPAPSDDLVIRVPHDVQLNEQRVWTSSRVEFALGPHRGSGRNMEIRLIADPRKGIAEGRNTPIAGIRSIEILHDVQASLVLPRDSSPPPEAGTRSPSLGQLLAADAPLEISCQGSFYVQPENLQARFEQDVELLHANPTGPANQLSCENLNIHFEPLDSNPHPESTAGVSAAVEPAGVAAHHAQLRIRPRRIVANGAPVIVRLASHNTVARCERLDVDLIRRRIEMITEHIAEASSIAQASNEIRAPRLRYDFDQVDPQGRIGTLHASGPGSLQAVPDERRPDSIFSANWQQELKVVRVEGVPVLSLLGSPWIRMTDIGSLRADGLHLWLRELPPDREPGHKPANRLHAVPQRLAAEGNVDLRSPRLTGRVDQLHLWFSHREQQRPAVAAAIDHDSKRGAVPAFKKQRGKAYTLAGKLLQVELEVDGMISNRRRVQTRVKNLAVKKNVLLREASAGEEPTALEIVGEELVVQNAESDRAQVALLGTPARISSRGARLAAPSLHLDRGANRLWTNEAGELTVPVNRDLNGQPAATPFDVVITWRERMDFDGKQAIFQGDVVGKGPHQSLQTRTLTASLGERIDFKRGNSSRRIDVAHAECRGGVVYDHLEVDAVGPLSHQHAELEQIAIDRVRGDIRGAGPGWIRSIRLGKQVANAALAARSVRPTVIRGQNEPRTTTTSQRLPLFGPPPGGPGGAAASGELEFVQVDFQQEVLGNLHRRELELVGHIKAAYGPVRSWHETLVAIDSQTGNVREGVVIMDCDRLKMIQWKTKTHPKPWIELHASGNVEIEGGTARASTFFATAKRGTYDGRSDRFILDGMGDYAVLMGKSPTREMTGQVVARKIEYHRKTGRIRQESANQFSLFEGLPPTP